jgi:hypothetical protein
MNTNTAEVRELARDLELLPPKMAVAVKAVNARAGARMKEGARSRVNVRTGRLRDSLKYRVTGNPLGKRGPHQGVTLWTELDYGPAQEFGMGDTPPNPALNDAMTAEVPDYLRALGAVLEGLKP